MNAANLSKSKRLQRVLGVLSDYRRHSTMDIIRKAKVCAVNSIVAELRMNRMAIDCKREGDKWFYQLEAK
jgi:hypothetical protein